MLATGDATAVRPANVRSRATNRPRKMVLDGRTALGRRVSDFAEAYAAGLGGWRALSDMQAANVRRAAELGALAEQARADALKTGNIDPATLVKLDGAASRALRSLAIPPGGTKPDAHVPLREKLAQLAAADSEKPA